MSSWRVRLADFARLLGPSHHATGLMFSIPGSSALKSIGSRTQSDYAETLLAGVDRPDLVLSDALERPLPRNRSTDGYDCILATPPWGRRTAPSSNGQVQFPSRNAETLFLQHVMANLRLGGRAVVALPGRPSVPTPLRPEGEGRVAVRISRGCRGLSAGRHVFTLDWNCRQPPGVSPHCTAVSRALRQYLTQGVGGKARSRRLLHS